MEPAPDAAAQLETEREFSLEITSANFGRIVFGPGLQSLAADDAAIGYLGIVGKQACQFGYGHYFIAGKAAALRAVMQALFFGAAVDGTRFLHSEHRDLSPLCPAAATDLSFPWHP